METSLSWLGRLVDAPSGADWQRLMDVYAPLLMSWAARANVLSVDREDLVQEVLIVVVRRVSEFEHQHAGAFRGWLRSILANHLKKYFRQHVAIVCEFDIDAVADPKSVLAQMLDREHDEHIARRAMKLVEADFNAVTWRAFVLQVLHDRPPAAVAQELRLSPNAVIKAKCRVLKRLREELRDFVE